MIDLGPLPAWMDHAACAGEDPDLFFPERGASHREAKAICAVCPVREQCLDFALTQRIKHGIWGGTSERERRRIRNGPAVKLSRPPERGPLCSVPGCDRRHRKGDFLCAAHRMRQHRHGSVRAHIPLRPSRPRRATS